MNLTLITAPATWPIDLDRLRDHLGEPREGVDGFEQEVDALVQEALATAVGMLDGDQGELGKALIAQVWQEEFERVPANGGAVQLGIGPVRGINKVEVRDVAGAWQVVDVLGFELLRSDGQYSLASDAWPASASYRTRLRVTYEAGFGASAAEIPPAIRRALLLLAAHFYEFRDPVVLEGKPTEVPISIERLLAPYKPVWV